MNKRMKSLRIRYLLTGLIVVVLISMMEIGLIKKNVRANEKTQNIYFSKDENSPEDEGFESEALQEDKKTEDVDTAIKDINDSDDALQASAPLEETNIDDNNEQSENNGKIISIECLYQGNGYPSGCEIFSTAMLLNYYGYNYSIEDIVNVLPIGNLYYEGNERVGPSPNTHFIGNPSSEDGFCCYEPVIEGVLKKLASDKTVENADGNTLEELCKKYIDNDIPVVIWGAVGMQPATSEISWRIEGTDEYYSWPNTEHCLLLVGYDEDVYYFNDPMTGELTKYDKPSTEARYSELGMQAVTIY